MQIQSVLKSCVRACILALLLSHSAHANPLPWMSTAPDNVRIPITSVKMTKTGGTSVTLYTCNPGSGNDNCYVSLMNVAPNPNFDLMKANMASYLATAPAATYTSITISSCAAPGTYYTAKVSLTTLLSGFAYVTSSTSSFIPKLPPSTPATEALINYSGCDHTITFPPGGVASGPTKKIFSFFDPEDLVWIADGDSTLGTHTAWKADSCTGTAANATSLPFLCMAQPRLGLVLDSAEPVLERYRINVNASFSLYFTVAGWPLSAQSRRHYIENTPYTLSFTNDTDVPVVAFTANASPANTYTIKTAGAQPGLPSYFLATAFSRSNSSGTYLDKDNVLRKYTAVKLQYNEEACNNPVHELPFHHNPYKSDDKFIRVANITSDDTLKLSAGVWGGHATPFTGHFFGDPKANWVALWRFDRSTSSKICNASQQSLTDPDVCTTASPSPGCGAMDVCGVRKSEVDEKIPLYTAYGNQFRIKSIKLKEWHDDTIGQPRYYYGTPAHFVVEAEVCGNILRFDHVRKISPYLAAYMTKLGLPDPTSAANVTQANANIDKEFMKDSSGAFRTIRLAAGEIFAEPQVIARAASPAGGPFNEVYYTGGSGYKQSPWAQMEVFVIDKNKPWIKTPFYKLLSATSQTNIKKIITSEQAVAGTGTSTFRYLGLTEDWLWKAESGQLFTAQVADDFDLSGVTSTLAGWFEREFALGACNPDSQSPSYSDCVKGDTHKALSNSMVVIYPINKTAPLYSASNYYSANVSYLIRKITRNVSGAWDSGVNTSLVGEVILPSTFIGSTSGTFIVRWRLRTIPPEATAAYEKFQRVGYNLVPADGTYTARLKLSWGTTLAESLIALPAGPTAPPSDAKCEAESLTCHDHRHNSAMGL